VPVGGLYTVTPQDFRGARRVWIQTDSWRGFGIGDMGKRTLEELDAVLQQAGLPNLADLRREGFTEEQIQKLLAGWKPTPPPPRSRELDNQ
jgi:hypothetical protein